MHIAHVAGRNESRVLLLAGKFSLSQLQFIEALPIRRQLHEIKFEVGILEFLRPAVVKGVHLVAVDFRFPCVVAPLIPYEPTRRVRHKRRHHGVPQNRRLLHVPGDHASRHARLPLVGHRVLRGLLKFRMSLVPRPRRPGVDVRAAPIGVDDADRHAKAGIQLQHVIKAHRRQRPFIFVRLFVLFEFFRRKQIPGRRYERPRISVMSPVDLYETQIRVPRHRHNQLSRAVPKSGILIPYRALHIALPGSEPHFAHQHIFDGLSLPAFLADRHGPAFKGSLHRLKLNRPVTVLIRLPGDLLPGERHSYLASGRSLSPHRNRNRSLQHRVVAERRSKLKLSQSRQRQQRNQKQYKTFFHTNIPWVNFNQHSYSTTTPSKFLCRNKTAQPLRTNTKKPRRNVEANYVLFVLVCVILSFR